MPFKVPRQLIFTRLIALADFLTHAQSTLGVVAPLLALFGLVQFGSIVNGQFNMIESPSESIRSGGPAERLAQKEANPTAAYPSMDPNHLVLQAVHQAIWGPSLSCRIRQTAVWDEQQLMGEGRYQAVGKGSGQLKTTMSVATGEYHSDFLQISDGRLIWTSTGDGEPPRRVYLDRVRLAVSNMNLDLQNPSDASLYLAIGGQPELLRSLYMRYRWFKIFAGIDEQGMKVWQLVGTLRTEWPVPASYSRADSILLTTPPSPEVPTDVRLTLARDGRIPLFPYKVEYFRRRAGRDGVPGKLVPVATLVYDQVVSPLTITPDQFEYQVLEEAERIEDETNDYLPTQSLAENPRGVQR